MSYPNSIIKFNLDNLRCDAFHYGEVFTSVYVENHATMYSASIIVKVKIKVICEICIIIESSMSPIAKCCNKENDDVI